MMRKIFMGIGVLFIAITGGGGCDIFTDMSNKTSDQAIMDDATNLINNQKYVDAINKLGLLTPAGQATTPAKILFASAYAGAGGLDLINLMQTLSGSGNPPTLFLTLLKAFKGSSNVSFLNEVAAESYMMSIAPAAANRTADENMFLMFVELAKLGTLFSFTADPLGTGSVNASFTSSCTGINQLQADHVVTAISIILDCMTALGNNALTGALPVAFTSCAGPLGAICGMTTLASVTPNAEQVGKTLVGENAMQIGLEIAATNGLCEVASGGPCPGNTFGSGQGLPNWCGFP